MYVLGVGIRCPVHFLSLTRKACDNFMIVLARQAGGQDHSERERQPKMEGKTQGGVTKAYYPAQHPS